MNAALVLAIGNDLRGDDGVGLLVARLLRGRLPATVRIVELGPDPLRLIDAWQGASNVLVVDAMRSGAEPGTVTRIDITAGHGHEVLQRVGAVSSHGVGVAVAVDMASALGRLPERLVIYGIEGAIFVHGAPLTPAVAEAAHALAGRLLAEFAGSSRNS